MDEVYKNMANYLTITPTDWDVLSQEDKKKYNWINQKGGNTGHFEFPERYWRLKTEEELKKQENYILELFNGTPVHRIYFEDNVPLNMKKYFVVELEGRYNKTDKKTMTGDEYILKKPSWDYIFLGVKKFWYKDN
jgi:hypothetical protein